MRAKAALRAVAIASIAATLLYSTALTSPAIAASCDVTQSLSKATKTVDPLDQGGSLTRFSFRAGQGNSSPYESRFTVSKTNLNYTTLTPTTAPYLRDRSQLSLAQGANAIVHVNGDFFDFSSRMLYSAVVRGASLSYAPQGKSRILGIRNVSATTKTGIRTKAIATWGSTKFAVAGVNLPILTGSSIVAYTSAYSSTTLPKSAAAILVVSGKVTRVYPNGTSVRPSSGYLFAATGSAATSLRKVTVGGKFSYKVPSGTIPAFTRDSLVPSGVISNSSGVALTAISAVNFWASNYASGAVIFDDAYDATPPTGGATVVIGSNNVVTKVATRGSSVAIPSGGYVVQFFGSSSSKASGFLVGSKVSIKRSFKTASGNTYDTAFGIGSTQITKGSVVATCEGNADTVRPRTSIGWDDYGNVYVATTTMGRDWPDGGQGGYRLGGSTVHQLADWLRDQGATNAVSLDGGGSTTMLAKLEGTYRRTDLPDGVWTRWIPMGVALIAR